MFSVGVLVGVLQVVVWVLVLPFRMSIRGRDVNKHKEHNAARIAREVGDSRGEVLHSFFSVCHLLCERFPMFFFA